MKCMSQSPGHQHYHPLPFSHGQKEKQHKKIEGRRKNSDRQGKKQQKKGNESPQAHLSFRKEWSINICMGEWVREKAMTPQSEQGNSHLWRTNRCPCWVIGKLWWPLSMSLARLGECYPIYPDKGLCPCDSISPCAVAKGCSALFEHVECRYQRKPW